MSDWSHKCLAISEKSMVNRGAFTPFSELVSNGNW